jgi:hypothetical protein
MCNNSEFVSPYCVSYRLHLGVLECFLVEIHRDRLQRLLDEILM